MNKNCFRTFHVIISLTIILALFCGIARADEKLQLKIGYWDERSEIVQDFIKKHPHVMISSGNMNARTTDDLISAFLTKEFDFDVFPLFSVQYDLQPLINKGYLADLSGSEEVRKQVGTMRSDVVSMVSRDGRIYALPYGLLIEYMICHPNIWEEVGLSTESIPNTFLQFLSFLEDWTAAEHPGYCICGQFDETVYGETRYTEWLLNLLFENDMLQQKHSGKVMEFTNPDLPVLMERCKKIGAKLYQLEPIPNQGKALFSIGESSVAEIQNMVSLRMDDRQPRLIKSYLWAVAVNEDSVVKPIATDFALSLLDNESILTTFLYSAPQSIPNHETEHLLMDAKSQQNTLQKKLNHTNLSVEAQVRLQEELDNLILQIQEYEKDENRYYLTAEQIEKFMILIDGLYIETPGPLSVGSKNAQLLNQWIGSYAAGIISAEQMLQRMNEICWMMQMEGS